MVTIIDGDQISRWSVSTPTDLRSLLIQAGLSLGPSDSLLAMGHLAKLDETIAPGSFPTVQIRRPVPLTVNGTPMNTTAPTVGEALAEAGVSLYAADTLDPPANTGISAGLAVTYTPSHTMMVAVDGLDIQVRTAATRTGGALASAGLPLIGLDFSAPPEDQPPPDDDRVRVVRVSEALVLAQKAIPYGTTSQSSADIELGQERVLQPGLSGRSVIRSTIRFEDEKEVGRQSEAEAVVRPPQDRVVARGSKIAVKTITVNGATIQYWRVLQMYATVYSPCNSATGTGGRCSSGTASGLPAGKGVVAVDPSLFTYLNGQRLYIPGYGYAVVGDVGGGYIVEQNLGISRYKWIDLGFDDSNLQDMTGWQTVYFLAPAPASIPEALK